MSQPVRRATGPAPGNRTLEVPAPIVQVDDGGKIILNATGNPTYEFGKTNFDAGGEASIGLKRAVAKCFCRKDSMLTPAQFYIFIQLATSCSRAVIEYYCHTETAKPLYVPGSKNRRAYAWLKTMGNVTRHFNYIELSRLTGYDEKTLRDALAMMLELGITVSADNHNPSVVGLDNRDMTASSEPRGRGRPPRRFRFLMHPELVFMGSMHDYNAYLGSAHRASYKWRDVEEYGWVP